MCTEKLNSAEEEDYSVLNMFLREERALNFESIQGLSWGH